jgi:membrane protein involved in colicin uptake
MRQILVAVCAALLVVGCGAKGGTQGQKAAIEQRDLFEQKDKQAADDAAKQAKIQQEQEELKRQLEEQKRKQEEAARKAAEPEQPVVKPLAETGVSGKSISDPTSMLKDPASALFNAASTTTSTLTTSKKSSSRWSKRTASSCKSTRSSRCASRVTATSVAAANTIWRWASAAPTR